MDVKMDVTRVPSTQ